MTKYVGNIITKMIWFGLGKRDIDIKLIFKWLDYKYYDDWPRSILKTTYKLNNSADRSGQVRCENFLPNDLEPIMKIYRWIHREMTEKNRAYVLFTFTSIFLTYGWWKIAYVENMIVNNKPEQINTVNNQL